MPNAAGQLAEGFGLPGTRENRGTGCDAVDSCVIFEAATKIVVIWIAIATDVHSGSNCIPLRVFAGEFPASKSIEIRLRRCVECKARHSDPFVYELWSATQLERCVGKSAGTVVADPITDHARRLEI